MTKHYTLQELKELSEDQGGGHRATDIRLEEGDTADDPSSTKRVLYGPRSVLYDFWPDGGVTYEEGIA